jgi:hypothetical protein
MGLLGIIYARTARYFMLRIFKQTEGMFINLDAPEGNSNKPQINKNV